MTDIKELALKFHETYERLAPSFGYETRADTKKFDPESPNGKLMIAVISEVLKAYTEAQEPACYIIQAETEDGFEYGYSASYPEAVHEHINDHIQRLVDNEVKPYVMHCVPLYAAPPLPAIPAHLCVVPREPTIAMIDAGLCGCMDNDVTVCVYTAMIAAGEKKS